MARSQRERNELLVGAVTGAQVARGRARRSADRSGYAYQFKLILFDAPVPVWRRVLVHGEMSLRSLNRVVRKAFGWDVAHGYTLGVRQPWTAPRKAVVKRLVRVCDVVSWGDGLTFSYEYGGRGWNVDAVVEALVRTEGKLQPSCLAGAGYSSAAKDRPATHEEWWQGLYGVRSEPTEQIGTKRGAPIDVAAIDARLKRGRYPLIEKTRVLPRRGRRRRRKRP